MIDLISNIKILITESEYLLTKDPINELEIKNYKKKCALLFVFIINENFNETTNELAKAGLSLKIWKIKNPVVQWIYNVFSKKYAFTYNAPFLTKHTDSAINKKYVFWTKRKLEGILFNMDEKSSVTYG